MKGDQFRDVPGASQDDLFLEDSNGFRRLLRSYSHLNRTASEALQLDEWMRVLFTGAYGVDYDDVMTAKVNPNAVTLKYDKVINIKSGNDSGILRNYKHWHPMESNLVYEDEEQGQTINSRTYFSSTGKAGMGDYYVVDILNPHRAATSTDKLFFDPTATLYWHER